MVESIVVVVVISTVVVVVTVDGVVVVGDTGRGRCRVTSISRINSRPLGSTFFRFCGVPVGVALGETSYLEQFREKISHCKDCNSNGRRNILLSSPPS